MEDNIKPEISNPKKPKKEAPLSRMARRAKKVIGEKMNVFLQEYFLLRTKVEDPDGQEMADKFDDLDWKWKYFCRKWKNSDKRMKKSDGIYPVKDAFEKRIEQYTKQVKAAEKQLENKKQ